MTDTINNVLEGAVIHDQASDAPSGTVATYRRYQGLAKSTGKTDLLLLLLLASEFGPRLLEGIAYVPGCG